MRTFLYDYVVYHESEISSALKMRLEILKIMDVYHEQKKSMNGIVAPGGLERMGDVWKLLLKWEEQLR